jgi:hypothetical protein
LKSSLEALGGRWAETAAASEVPSPRAMPVTDRQAAGAEMVGQPPGRLGGDGHGLVGGHAVLDRQAAKQQHARLAVVLGVDPGDQPAAGQHRHGVVAVLALGRRRVHLDAVVEAEQVLGAFPPPDQRVERAEQHRRVLRATRDGRARLDVGGLLPAGDGDLLEQPGGQRLRQRRLGVLGTQAEVVIRGRNSR